MVNLLRKDRKEIRKPAHIQAHLAAQHTGDRFAAKRAFILPTHPSPPATLETR